MYYSINNGDYQAELGKLETTLVGMAKHVNRTHEYPSDFEIEAVEIINDSGNPVGVFSKDSIGLLNSFIGVLLAAKSNSPDNIDWETITDNWEGDRAN